MGVRLLDFKEAAMDHAEWQSFRGWLRTASRKELELTRLRLLTLLDRLQDADVRRDARRMAVHIDKEMAARREAGD